MATRGVMHSEPEIDALIERIVAEVEPFLAHEVNPGAIERWRRAAPLPAGIVERAGALGLPGYPIDARYGGRGRSFFEWGVMLQQVARLSDDVALAPLLSIATSVAMQIIRSGRPELIERYALPLIHGESLAAFAYTDTTDGLHMKTTAREVRGGWVLDGYKPIMSAGAMSSVILVYARDEASDDLLGFLIEPRDPGVSIEPVDGIGMRTLGLASLTLRNTEVGAERLLVPTDGLSHAQALLNNRRVVHACQALGGTERILEKLIELVLRPDYHGGRLAEAPSVHAQVGKIHFSIETTRAVTYEALRRFSAGRADAVWDTLGTIAKHQAALTMSAASAQMIRALGSEARLGEYGLVASLPDSASLILAGTASPLIELDLGVAAISQWERRRRTRAQRRDAGGHESR